MYYRRGNRRVNRRKGRRNHINPIKRYIKTNRNVKWGRIARDVMYLKSLLNVEKKYLDQDYNNSGYSSVSATSTAGSAGASPVSGYFSYPITYPALGDDFNQRSGHSIKVNAIQLKGSISVNATTGFVGGPIKLFIIRDNQAGSGGNVDPVPNMWDADAAGLYHLGCLRFKEYAKRYTIIGSKRLHISSGAQVKKDFDIYRKTSTKVKFDNTTAADFMNTKYYVVALVDSPIPSHGTVIDLVCQSRLTYVDN